MPTCPSVNMKATIPIATKLKTKNPSSGFINAEA